MNFTQLQAKLNVASFFLLLFALSLPLHSAEEILCERNYCNVDRVGTCNSRMDCTRRHPVLSLLQVSANFLLFYIFVLPHYMKVIFRTLTVSEAPTPKSSCLQLELKQNGGS